MATTRSRVLRSERGYERLRFSGRGRGGFAARSEDVIFLIFSSPLSTCSRISSSFSLRFCSARSWGVLMSVDKATGAVGGHRKRGLE